MENKYLPSYHRLKNRIKELKIGEIHSLPETAKVSLDNKNYAGSFGLVDVVFPAQLNLPSRLLCCMFNLRSAF